MLLDPLTGPLIVSPAPPGLGPGPRAGRPRVGVSPRLTAPLVATLLLAAACDDGHRISLGDQSPRPYHFGPATLLVELASSDKSDNPTLTADLLEIYFTSDRDGSSSKVWFARRDSVNAPFGPPAPVANVNSDGFETSSAISDDGLTLWLGSDRPGSLGLIDIWRSTRPDRASPWSTPLNLSAMNSTARDLPRPVGLHGLVMPIGSDRDTPDIYQTMFSARADRAADFGAPTPIPELMFPNRGAVDGFLSDDGLTLWFSSSEVGTPADLFVAWRRSLDAPFAVFAPLDDLNTASDERDPWLSPDGTTLFFTSDRSGTLNIYTASVSRAAPLP